ncbi:Post-GPI attachment to proteins factor 3 [Hypsibius exemplaris]|uniref:Post-GPI attachment to proteins factor 3 n=1 Tax=Hypsibius exemplaris TaxID=2072580 RepID=A0A1W0X2U4_HYPEX|nr:Post-GPI attachment to proteins factor 3 [Hypsibius exemplaris]
MDSSVFFLLILSFFCLTLTSCVYGSVGDRSEAFRNCLSECFWRKCPAKAAPQSTIDLPDDDWSRNQPWYLKLLVWECEDECKYSCMWEVVEIFQKNDRAVPQFYGKWPFVRLFGIQEPASALFSVFNGLAHFFMLQKIVQRVPRDAPTYRLWYSYALISMNAWFWSAVFHTRDFPFTEKMDYFGALAGVLFSFYTFILRMIGSDQAWKWLVPGAACLTFFVYHVHYLAFVHFDYGYNMLANVTVGILNSVGWLVFCAVKRNGRSWRDMAPCALSVLFVDCLMLLELLDFPPFLWTFDAHSLWHFGTIPVTFVWYKFLIDDARHLCGIKKTDKIA